VDTSLRTSWIAREPAGLVVAGRVQGELAKQGSLLGEDAHVEVFDQDDDLGAGVPAADADVVELAAVAEGDRAAAVDCVVAYPAVCRQLDARALGGGLDPGGSGRAVATMRKVGGKSGPSSRGV